MIGFSKEMFRIKNDIAGKKKRAESHGIEQKFWIELEGKDFLYKKDNKRYLGFAELFYSYLGKVLDFNNVNVYPAKDGLVSKGVIVESYITKDVIITYSFDDFIERHESRLPWNKDYPMEDHEYYYYGRTLEELLLLEKNVKDDGIEFDKNLIKDFKKMVLVDFLLLQCDRHGENIEFIIKKQPNSKKLNLSLAPIYDNGRSLALSYGLDDYSDEKLRGALFGPVSRICMGYEKRKYFSEDCITPVARNIAKEIIKDEELREFYKNFKSINLFETLKNVAEAGDYTETFNHEQLDFIAKLITGRIKMIDSQIKILQSENTDESSDDFNNNDERIF